MSTTQNLTGVKIGNIRFLEPVKRNRKWYWKARCERVKADGSVCGKDFVCYYWIVIKGVTKSCGCYRSERSKKYWSKLEMLLKHRYYNILHRCYDQKDAYYYNYGGRGITVCDEWRNDKDAFIRYCLSIGARLDLEIDRIDNDGPYAPGNIRFVTRRENTRNRRCTVYVDFGDERIQMADVPARMGVSYKTVACWHKRGVLADRIADHLAGRTVFKKGGRKRVVRQAAD